MNTDTTPSPDKELTQPLPRPAVPEKLAVELAATDFGAILTNPLLSRVIQSVLSMLVVFIGTKVFKLQAEDIHVQDYVELSVVLIGAIAVIVYRIRAKGSIKSPEATAKELLPTLQSAMTPQIRQDLLNLIKTKNPKVYDIIQQLL